MTTGTTVQMISSRVAPWICGPSAVRARLPRRYLMMKAIRAPSTIRRSRPVKIETKMNALWTRCAFGECGSPAGTRRCRRARSGRHERDDARDECGKGGPAHAEWHRIERGSAESGRAAREVGRHRSTCSSTACRSTPAWTSTDRADARLPRELSAEGRLGFWRWLSPVSRRRGHLPRERHGRRRLRRTAAGGPSSACGRRVGLNAL